jgi:hypothetical protein
MRIPKRAPPVTEEYRETIRKLHEHPDKSEKCKTSVEMHEELKVWDKLIGDERFDQNYVLGFRMALKWVLGMKFKLRPTEGEKR